MQEFDQASVIPTKITDFIRKGISDAHAQILYCFPTARKNKLLQQFESAMNQEFLDMKSEEQTKFQDKVIELEPEIEYKVFHVVKKRPKNAIYYCQSVQCAQLCWRGKHFYGITNEQELLLDRLEKNDRNMSPDMIHSKYIKDPKLSDLWIFNYANFINTKSENNEILALKAILEKEKIEIDWERLHYVIKMS